MRERFFILTPTPTEKTICTAEREANGLPKDSAFGRYLDASGEPMKWSGTFPLPAIGDRVYLRINSIGWGYVKGYAEVEGFLGLMVEPLDPPAWYIKQGNAQREEHAQALRMTEEKRKIERLRLYPKWILDGFACVFGAEISLDK